MSESHGRFCGEDGDTWPAGLAQAGEPGILANAAAVVEICHIFLPQLAGVWRTDADKRIDEVDSSCQIIVCVRICEASATSRRSPHP
ncbi:hypothetical protein AB0O28_04575 [Microbispora sp. NPDC088329]|uniref:hypothetical protein n=1 Tax=Microbispora sp. NPDC088329 TaxID=3154869 RepID=UPI003428CC62